jgi:NRAMP (natural resistance-associated macrophage protein)-like metal ion transporter
MGFLKNIQNKLGPGLITGASDDDPSGILTYLQSGVIMGIASLWTALVTLPLMYVIQEMCGRLGLVTDKGLVKLIREHYGKTVLFIIAIISVVTITVNIGADLLAIGVVAEKLSGLPRWFWLPVAAGLILSATIFFSYRVFARVLKWLTFSLFFYIATVLYIHIDWREAILATIWPAHFVWNATNLMLVAAIVGTTISPYLFFWQTQEEVEERDDSQKKRGLKHFLVTKHELKDLKEDTFAGMLFSNAVMWFLILAAAQLSRFYGLGVIENFDQAALALQPLLGDQAFLMFSLGIIGTGLLAIPVLAGSVGYILAEMFGWREGLNLHFRKATSFYVSIIIATSLGMILSFTGVDPVQLLIYTAVFYTIITPPLIFIIIRLSNNKQIMGKRKNTLVSNILGWTAFGLISVLVIFYLVNLLKN